MLPIFNFSSPFSGEEATHLAESGMEAFTYVAEGLTGWLAEKVTEAVLGTPLVETSLTETRTITPRVNNLSEEKIKDEAEQEEIEDTTTTDTPPPPAPPPIESKETAPVSGWSKARKVQVIAAVILGLGALAMLGCGLAGHFGHLPMSTTTVTVLAGTYMVPGGAAAVLTCHMMIADTREKMFGVE